MAMPTIARSGCRAGAWPLLCFLIVTGSVRLLAQTTSVIQGRVVDAQGLAIAGSEVMVSSPALIGQVRIASDLTGWYRVPGLPAGIYSLRVSAPGFSAKQYEGLAVTVNRVVTFDIDLVVSALQETIVVAASVPQLDAGVSSSGVAICRSRSSRCRSAIETTWT